MDENQMSPLQKFEQAAKNPEMTDKQILELFLNLEISSDEDIGMALLIIAQNRANLMAALTVAYSNIQKSKRGSGCRGCKNCKCRKKKPDQSKPLDNNQDGPAQ